jgi:hypothetical protein
METMFSMRLVLEHYIYKYTNLCGGGIKYLYHDPGSHRS